MGGIDMTIMEFVFLSVSILMLVNIWRQWNVLSELDNIVKTQLEINKILIQNMEVQNLSILDLKDEVDEFIRENQSNG